MRRSETAATRRAIIRADIREDRFHRGMANVANHQPIRLELHSLARNSTWQSMTLAPEERGRKSLSAKKATGRHQCAFEQTKIPLKGVLPKGYAWSSLL